MGFKKIICVLSIVIACITTAKSQVDSVPDKEKLIEFYESQKYNSAAEYLNGFYKSNTEDPKELSQLGYVYMMSGKLPEAEVIYLRLNKQNPKNLAALFSLASLNVKRGNDVKAKAYYKEIELLDSTNFTVYKQLAALSSGEDVADKLKYLKKANQLNPVESDVAFTLCELFFKLNLYSNSEAVLAPALAADSANIQLLKIKMPICIAAKKYSESIETGKRLMFYGDSSTFVINNLGKSYFMLNDYKNALKYFLTINDKATENETLLYNISLCYRGMKDYPNAAIYLQKTITEGISTRTASYYGLLGDSYEFTNQYDQAIKSYRRGLLFENNGSLYYNIALVYETRLNDKKNAIANYNLYLKNFKDMSKNPKLSGFIKNKIEELKR